MARKNSRLITLVLAACLVFSLMGVPVSAEDVVIEKVTATSDKEPVVMRTPGEIVFTTSTEGAVISSVTWTDSTGRELGKTEAFKQGSYTLVVKLSAKDGYVFGAAAAGVLYNNSSNCVISVSADGKTASLRREYGMLTVYRPTIQKQPTEDPPVNPGGRVSYAASASFAARHAWYLVSPDGKERIDLIAARERFSGADIQDTGNSLTINKVPAEMNGWKAMCRFYESTDTYWTDTQTVEIKVKLPDPTPTPEPTPAPSATPGPSDAPQLLDWQSNEGGHWHVNEDGEAGDLAEHSFVWSAPNEKGEEKGVCSVCGYTTTRVSAAAPTPVPTAVPQPRAWQSNEGGHWHESADGEISDLAEHSFVFSAADDEGKEVGVCSVCGYTTVRESPELARQALKSKLLIGLCVAVAVLMMLSLVAPRKKKNKR